MLKRCHLVVVFLLIYSHASAASWYIDVDASGGTGCGAIGTPCTSISELETEQTVTTGDDVYFDSSDEWTFTLATWPVIDTIAGVSYHGDSWGGGSRATFRATNNGTTGACAIHIDADNTVIHGFEVDMGGYNWSGISTYSATADVDNVDIDNCLVYDSLMGESQWNYGIYLGGHSENAVTNVTLSNTTVHTVGHEGIALYPSDNNQYTRSLSSTTVSNCTVYNFGLDGSTTSDGIYITNDASSITVEDCTVSHDGSGSRGISIGCKNSPTCPDNIVLRRNRVSGVSGGAIQIGAHAGFVLDGTYEVYNNFLYKARMGVYITNNITGSTIRILNNTAYYSDGSTFHAGALRLYNLTATGTPILLKNNIFFAEQYYAMKFDDSADEGYCDHSNNLVYRDDGTTAWYAIGGSEYTQSQVVSSWDATAENTDPLFVSIIGDDYDIGVGSDAINNGADLSVYFTTDYYENTRSDWDIGAHEYGAGSQSPQFTGIGGSSGLNIE